MKITASSGIHCQRGQLTKSSLLLIGLVQAFAATQGSAQNYTSLHDFAGTDGANPWSAVILSGTALYGNTESGGSGGSGTVFRVNTDGTGFQVLHHFAPLGSDGFDPMGPLLLSGETLYGTCYAGGTSGAGVLFKLNTDGTGFAVLHHFAAAPDGAGPRGCLALSGGRLFGTTRGGGDGVPYGEGTIYRINSDGTGHQVLRSFGRQYGLGDDPSGGLVLSGSTLYGTASGWSSSGDGSTVFRIDTDGSGYGVVASTGYMPMAPVTIAGDRIYGTTVHGAGTSMGTLFTVRTDGKNYTRLRDLTMPYGGLVLSGTTLFGTTDTDSGAGHGTVFMIQTNGDRFTVLKTFAGSDGAGPTAALLRAENALYGTTRSGGAFSKGVVFRLDLPLPAITRAPQSQTAELGSNVRFRATTTSESPTYRWYFNETNALIGPTTRGWIELTNVQASASGSYTVVVSDDFGSVTSPPALLNTIPPVEQRRVLMFALSGDVGKMIGIDSRDSLNTAAPWQQVINLSLADTRQFLFDTSPDLASERWYRAWQPLAVSAPPSLAIRFIPAVTLTGSLGGKLRVEAINQTGPIDAWFTLDTVTLTNTTQTYFDVTAPSYGIRLYRLTPVR